MGNLSYQTALVLGALIGALIIVGGILGGPFEIKGFAHPKLGGLQRTAICIVGVIVVSLCAGLFWWDRSKATSGAVGSAVEKSNSKAAAPLASGPSPQTPTLGQTAAPHQEKPKTRKTVAAVPPTATPAQSPAPTLPPQQTVNAPNGIGTIGGTLINPQVNNFGPLPAKLTFTEESPRFPQGDNQPYLLKVHVKTDQPIPHARIEAVFSGPVDTDDPSFKNFSFVSGAPMQSVSLEMPTENGSPIKNRLIWTIEEPSVLAPGVDFIISLSLKSALHVEKVICLTD